MDKEKKIEEMARAICNTADYFSCAECSARKPCSCQIYTEKLVNAGYGDVKQAKQEFADQLHDKLESYAMCFGRNPESDAGVYLTDIKQAIKELLEG